MTWKQPLTIPESMSKPLYDFKPMIHLALPCSCMTFPFGCRNIKEVVEGKPSLLIEHVAENIAASVLTEHRGVLGIRVAVKKPHVAIPGIFNTMGMMLCTSFLHCFSSFPCPSDLIIMMALSRDSYCLIVLTHG